MAKASRLVLALVGALLISGCALRTVHVAQLKDQPARYYNKTVTVKGTVTAFNWANPHVMIDLEVKTESGKVEKWSVGGPSTDRMAGNGWDKNTLKAGDVITGYGYRYSDGANVVQLQKIVMANGKEMLLYGRR